jgi:integrative and conjugative element protein (TIGR02256 family)
MKFRHGEAVIAFSPSSLALFEKHRQRSPRHREIGGQLFARFEEENLLIELATAVPGSRFRFSFQPDRRSEQIEIERYFAEGLHYVGDWHTHPEASPQPSAPDVRKMSGIFSESEHQLPFMLMVIVGLAPFPDGLFIGAVSSHRLTVLRSID